MRALAPLFIAALVLSGCTSDEGQDHDGMEPTMGPGSYMMHLSGMPTSPMAPGHGFNITVQAMMGMSGMRAATSDHIGAHFWNRTMTDPTGNLAGATTCQHQVGEAPGTWKAQCTAPAQPGTYHLRSHMRMMDDGGQMHHWWSDEQTFTVA